MSIETTEFVAEDRSWDLGPHGNDPGSNPNAALLVSLFTAGTHYPKGFIPSGTLLGKVTATGLYGPFDPAATDGRQVAAGHLFASRPVRTGVARIPGALKVHGFVNPARLPLQSGTGSLTDAARVHLHGIHYSDKPTILEGGEG